MSLRGITSLSYVTTKEYWTYRFWLGSINTDSALGKTDLRFDGSIPSYWLSCASWKSFPVCSTWTDSNMLSYVYFPHFCYHPVSWTFSFTTSRLFQNNLSIYSLHLSNWQIFFSDSSSSSFHSGKSWRQLDLDFDWSVYLLLREICSLR